MCVKPRLALGALVMFAKQAFMGEKRKHRFLHLNWDHVNVDSLEAASYMAAPFLFPLESNFFLDSELHFKALQMHHTNKCHIIPSLLTRT